MPVVDLRIRVTFAIIRREERAPPSNRRVVVRGRPSLWLAS
jgi:hypothetical protein